jgi:RNA recognition motif-containing protein
MKVKGVKARDYILNHSPYKLSDRLFHAKPFLKGKQLKQFQENVKKRRVFINCIPGEFSNELLKEAFSIFGKVEDGFAIKEVNMDSKNVGYGFVMFKDIKSAEKAIEMGYLTVKNSKLQIIAYEKGQKR